MCSAEESFMRICSLLLVSTAKMAVFSATPGNGCRAEACQIWSRAKFRAEYLYRPGFAATFILLDVRAPSKARRGEIVRFLLFFFFLEPVHSV